MNYIDVGDKAPGWALRDQNGRKVDINRHFGNLNIVLSFHPLAWTPVCSKQMQALEDNYAELVRLETVAYGISVDSVPCKKAWAGSLGIVSTRLPSDFWPHGGVARLYGVFLEELGYASRAVFVIDKAGKVSFKKVYPLRELPDMQEILNAVRQHEPLVLKGERR